jgi:hypothetical protein
MAVVDFKALEIWVQSGLPDEGELIFNIYLHNLATTEWEVRVTSPLLSLSSHL